MARILPLKRDAEIGHGDIRGQLEENIQSIGDADGTPGRSLVRELQERMSAASQTASLSVLDNDQKN